MNLQVSDIYTMHEPIETSKKCMIIGRVNTISRKAMYGTKKEALVKVESRLFRVNDVVSVMIGDIVIPSQFFVDQTCEYPNDDQQHLWLTNLDTDFGTMLRMLKEADALILNYSLYSE